MPVLRGEIVVGEWVWRAVLRHYRDLVEGPARGLYFDPAAGLHVVQFIERWFQHVKGSQAGEPILLDPWQRFWTMVLYGWKLGRGGPRRFQRGLEGVPRKNGKSTWKAPQGAYLWMMDGEAGAEVYALGTTREQAMTVYAPAAANVRRWLRQSPRLQRCIKLMEGKNQEAMWLDHVALFRPLPANDDALDGLNPHAILFDELHAQKTRGLWDVMESALGARRQPLLSAITTAGWILDGICTELLDYLKRVLKGEIEDDSFFGYWYAADEGDDPYTLATWRKANPGLGTIKTLHHMQTQARKAQALPSARANFLTKDLNIFVGQEGGWFDMRVWDQGTVPVLPEHLAGRRCYGGLDLSSTRDLTAFVLVFPPDADDEPWRVLCYFWAPQAKLDEDEGDDRAPYKRWAEAGWLTVTPGDVVDYLPVKRTVQQACVLFDVVEIGYDRWNAQSTTTELMDAGVPVVEVQQTTQGVGGGAKQLELLVYGKRLHHGGNPVLRYCADNTALLMDSNENFRPDKRRSRPNGRIDGISALCTALSRAVAPGAAGPELISLDR